MFIGKVEVSSEVVSVDGKTVYTDGGGSFTKRLEPFPDKLIERHDFSVLNNILSDYQNTEEFISHYVIENNPLETELEELLVKYFRGSLRRFYLFLKANQDIRYSVTVSGLVNLDCIEFMMNKSDVTKMGSDVREADICLEDNDQFRKAFDESLMAAGLGDFESQQQQAIPMLCLKSDFDSTTLDEVYENLSTKGNQGKKVVEWLKSGVTSAMPGAEHETLYLNTGRE